MKKLQEFYKNKNVLVTGGAGFIGSYIVEELITLGANVTVIDNLSNSNLQNIKHVLDKIQFIQKDIRDFDDCMIACKNKQIVFHLAAFISVPKSMQQPSECNSINIQGTYNLLQACVENKVERFIFSSSAAVYGNKEGVCSEEDYCNPTSVYGYSKLIGELLCKQYYSLFALKTVCLRYFNVYGERQNPLSENTGVYARFKHCLEQNLPITIYGDGNQTRDFVGVEQVINANLTIAANEEALNGQSINIASGYSISLLELLYNLKNKYKIYNNEITFKDAIAADIKYSIAAINKLKQIQI